MSLIKQLAKETAIYGISSILVRLLPFAILTPYLTNFFSRKEYGVITEVYTYTALLVVLFTYRMETTFFRFGSKGSNLENAFSTAAWSLILSTLGWMLILLTFLPNLALFIHKDLAYQDLVLLMLGIVATDALVAIPFARLRLEKRPIRFAAIKSINVVVNICAVFFFLELCPRLINNGWTSLEIIYNADNRISYVLWANLLASFITLLLFIPTYSNLQWAFDKQLWKKMIRYTGPLIIVGIAGVVNQLSGNTLIHNLASDDYDFNKQCEGVFAAVAKIAVFMNLYTQAFNYAAEPFFFSNADRSDAKQQYADVARIFTIVGSIVFLGLWLYLDIIKYFIGSDFHDGLEIVPVLLLAFLFLGLYYNFSIWYKLTDQTRFGGYIAVGGSIITISLNVILITNSNIPCYAGPAWAALACYAFMALAAYSLGQRKYPIPYDIRSMVLVLLITVIYFGLNYYWRSITNWNQGSYLLINSAWLLIYFFTIYKIEYRFLNRLFSK